MCVCVCVSNIYIYIYICVCVCVFVCVCVRLCERNYLFCILFELGNFFIFLYIITNYEKFWFLFIYLIIYRSNSDFA